MILPSIAFAIPLSVLVLSNFIRDVPNELFESMRLDGCSEWGTLWRLAFPLTRPALVTVTIYNALGVWNNFLLPLILTQSPDQAHAAAGAVDLPGPVRRQRAGRAGLGAADHAADPGLLRGRSPPAAQRPHRRLQQVGGSTGEQRTQVVPGDAARSIACVPAAGPRGSAPCLAGPLGVCRLAVIRDPRWPRRPGSAPAPKSAARPVLLLVDRPRLVEGRWPASTASVWARSISQPRCR